MPSHDEPTSVPVGWYTTSDGVPRYWDGTNWVGEWHQLATAPSQRLEAPLTPDAEPPLGVIRRGARLATVACCLAAAAVVSSLIPRVGLIIWLGLGLAAIVLAVLALARHERTRLALVALVLGVLSLVIPPVVAIVVLGAAISNTDGLSAANVRPTSSLIPPDLCSSYRDEVTSFLRGVSNGSDWRQITGDGYKRESAAKIVIAQPSCFDAATVHAAQGYLSRLNSPSPLP